MTHYLVRPVCLDRPVRQSRQWNWGDGLSGIRELLLRRKRRIRSFAGAHVEPRETRIFILIFYPGAAPVLRVLRILRSLRILRFCSRTELFAHPTPVTSYVEMPVRNFSDSYRTGNPCRGNGSASAGISPAYPLILSSV